MTNGSKLEPRKQMNRALKPGGVRILNLSQTILQCLCVWILTSNAFSICLDGHFNAYFGVGNLQILLRFFVIPSFQSC